MSAEPRTRSWSVERRGGQGDDEGGGKRTGDGGDDEGGSNRKGGVGDVGGGGNRKGDVGDVGGGGNRKGDVGDVGGGGNRIEGLLDNWGSFFSGHASARKGLLRVRMGDNISDGLSDASPCMESSNKWGQYLLMKGRKGGGGGEGLSK